MLNMDYSKHDFTNIKIYFQVLFKINITTITSFVILHTLMASIICYRCDMFLKDVRKLKQLCISVQACHVEGKLIE
jgi:hypothetical protein